MKYSNLDLLKFIISLGHPLDITNIEGDTALHLACSECNIEIVSYLLQQNANTSISNNHGDYPIHKAVEYNCLSIIKELINNHISINQHPNPHRFLHQFLRNCNPQTINAKASTLNP